MHTHEKKNENKACETKIETHFISVRSGRVEKENVLHFEGQKGARTTGKQQESGNKLGDKPTKSIGNILTKLQLKVSRQHVGCCQSGWHFPGAQQSIDQLRRY